MSKIKVRPVKFRMWAYGTMVDDCSAQNAMQVEDGQPFINRSIEMYQKDGVVFMLNTGIKDIFDREIYEGDILIKTYWDHVDDKIKKGTFIVEWRDGGLRARQNKKKNYIIVDVNLESSEIIGNIYEHKNLLMI